jgi:hypothetical protein
LRNASSTCRDTSIASSLAQRVFDLQGYVHRILAGQRVFDLLQVLLGLTERAVVALVVARTVEISHSTARPFEVPHGCVRCDGKGLIDFVRLITVDLSGSIASE